MLVTDATLFLLITAAHRGLPSMCSLAIDIVYFNADPVCEEWTSEDAQPAKIPFQSLPIECGREGTS